MQSTTITFDSTVYSSDALLNTAYWCANQFQVDIKAGSPHNIYSVTITPHKNNTLTQDFLDSFIAMVTHNEIRIRLRSNFKELETLIVRKAFSPISTHE